MRLRLAAVAQRRGGVAAQSGRAGARQRSIRIARLKIVIPESEPVGQTGGVEVGAGLGGAVGREAAVTGEGVAAGGEGGRAVRTGGGGGA